MIAVSPLRNNKDGNQEEMESFSITTGDFGDLSDGNLLESTNFDDFFVGINVDGDILPDLEMDPEMFAEFSVSYGEESEMNSSASLENNIKLEEKNSKKCYEDKTDCSRQGSEEIVSKRDESVVVNPLLKDAGGKGRKSSTKSKNPQGKRKVKVDWTPELHRRFVQAVEQLGVDKAVPSRILEIMGIDCLTRHNIASHLQKYRSHRKHLLTREAEAASWNQRRQVYGGVGGKREVMSPWPAAPTMGFPPPPMTTPLHHFRPLHVWGHPSMDHSFMHMWPKPQPALSWPPSAAPPPPPQDPSFWHSHHQRTPTSTIIPGIHCFPQPLTTMRPSFGCPIPGISAPGPAPAPAPFDFHPSKESIDAAIGDVLSKPWLPLPLGLKAPALDSVMGELQRQGVSNIPP
uniref:MYB family transcription factor n=1 Tax=Melilotus albus TaxID=47082 RepID=A0A896W4F3_MELAB|nr:MYB family transcription factor [Melilotus albus]